MLFTLFASTIASITYKYDYKFGNHHDVTLQNNYDRALLTLPAGQGLMMVDWEDAILSISVQDISPKHARLTKHSGYSIFLFNKDAVIDIMFHKKMTYSVFTCPYVSSSDGAKQFISNYARNEISIDTGRDVYFKVYGNYDMSGKLSKDFLTTGKLYYFVGAEEHSTKSIDSINLQNIENHAVIKIEGAGEVKGTLNLNCKPEFNPTVPTFVELNIDGKIKDKQNNYKDTVAYGGAKVYNNDKQITFSQLVNTQYVTISNNIENHNHYYLYAKNEDGDYKLIKRDDPYIESKLSNFKVEVYVRSAMGLENCTDYVFVTNIDSHSLTLSDFDIKYAQIKDEHIPDVCIYQNDDDSSSGNKNSKKTGIIIGVVVAVIVVIAIVIVVVIFVIKKKKSDRSEQEDKNTSLRSLTNYD